MGNLQAQEENEKIFDINKIYWDSDGNLRHGHSDRDRDAEIIALIQEDTYNEEDPEALWMIIPSRWVRKWLLFAHYKICDSPGKIDMFPLLQEDPWVQGGWRPKRTLKAPVLSNDVNIEDHPGHYRRITLGAWLKLADLYKVTGYALAVRGVPYDDLSRWRVFKNPYSIDVSKLPPPILPAKPEESKDKEEVKPAKRGFFGL